MASVDSLPPPELLAKLRPVAVVLMLGAVAWLVLPYALKEASSNLKFNLLPVVAFGLAFGLIGGNLRLASLWRSIAAFALVAIPLAFVVDLGFQPWALTRAILREQAADLLVPFIGGLFAWALFAWVFKTLGAGVVTAARVAAGRPMRRMWVPMVVAALLAGTSIVFMVLMLRSESARTAERLVQERLGPGYQTQVIQLSVRKSNAGGHVAATVVAWRGDAVQVLPVQWKE